MNDDWDGSDWENFFAGPNDDLIVRADAFHDEVEDGLDSFSKGKVTVFDEDAYKQYLSQNEFISFPSAATYAKEQASAKGQCFVITRFDWGWRVEKELPTLAVLPLNSLSKTAAQRIETALQLIEALQEKDFQRADYLLQQPILVNTSDLRGITPLMVAAYRGVSDICEKLLNMGAIADHFFNSSDFYDAEQLSTLERANASGDAKTIELISRAYVQERWDVQKTLSVSNLAESTDFFGEDLVEAARWGMTSVVVEMIEAGADINYSSHNDFYSPLSAAFESDRRDTSLVLISMGANLDWMKKYECITENTVAFESAVSDFRNAFSSVTLSKLFDS